MKTEDLKMSEQFDQYKVDKKQLRFRDPTEEEKEFLISRQKKGLLSTGIFAALFIGVILYTFFRYADDPISKTAILIFLSLSVFLFGRMMFRILKTNDGVYDAVIIDIRSVRKKKNHRVTYVSIWSEEHRQFADRIQFSIETMGDYAFAQQGDPIKIYKINDYNIFAAVSPEFRKSIESQYREQ